MEDKILTRIKFLREAKGFKQNEMAHKLNIEPSTYNKLESGENHSWAKYLPQILETLEISIEDFFKDLDGNKMQQNKDKEQNLINNDTNNVYIERKEHCNSLKEELDFLKKQIEEKDKIISKLLK